MTLMLGYANSGALVQTDVNYLNHHVAVFGSTGSGKCLHPDTPVMLHSGEVVLAKEVVLGDKLMGPDGAPRTVYSTTIGMSDMYKIIPTKGESWICNDVHVLTLVHTQTGEVIDIPLNEYLKKPDSFKHLHKQFFTSVDFPEREAPAIDPYFLGVWFGDGSKRLHSVQVSKPDIEIKEACQQVADSWGLTLSEDTQTGKCPTYSIVSAHPGKVNPLLRALKNEVSFSSTLPPSISDNILRGNRETRLQFLAGFLDTDGHLCNNVFEFTQKSEDYVDDVKFICRTLGLQATKSVKELNGVKYFRLCISGDLSVIPTRLLRKQASPRQQKKDVTRTGFTVENLGEGVYAGFTLDGDGRFLLGDCTVTHNTGQVISIMEQAMYHSIPVFAVDIKGDLCNAVQQRDDFLENLDVHILTPGGDHGTSVDLFSGLNDPDTGSSTLAQICELVGISATRSSKGFAFLSAVLNQYHAKKKGCSLQVLMDNCIEPKIKKVGMLPVEDAITSTMRKDLLTRLNSLYCDPKLEHWMSGMELDITKICKSEKTPVIIYSVTHLVDEKEREAALVYFFQKMVAWMRQEGGKKKMRGLLVVDECKGILPPHPYNPPTKNLIMTMITQGRDYGLGVLLATQNPKDICYNALGNCHTWLVGRLQAANSRVRVLEGVLSTGAYDKQSVDRMMTGLQKREFLHISGGKVEKFFSRDVDAQLTGPASIRELSLLHQFFAPVRKSRLKAAMEFAVRAFNNSKTDDNLRKVVKAQDAYMKADGDV